MHLKATGILLASTLLSACGDSGSKTSEEITPYQASANTSPSARFTEPDNVQERGNFTLDGSQSSDSDGSISTYNWDIDLGDYSGGHISLTENGINSTLVVGELDADVSVSVSLTVTDNDGATDSFAGTITIREIDVEKLPAMPADSAAGLEGTDSDGDGIRDDIEIKIYNLYPLSKDNREVLRKTAQVFQNILVTGNSDDDLDNGAAAEELAKLASCYIDHTDLNGREEVAKIKSMLLDTAERVEAYEKFLVSRNGTVQRTIEATFEDCRLPQN